MDSTELAMIKTGISLVALALVVMAMAWSCDDGQQCIDACYPQVIIRADPCWCAMPDGTAAQPEMGEP